MKDIESFIIKMNEVAVLIRMIDDTFVAGRVGFSDDKDGEQLEQSMNLLREQFTANMESLRMAYYGGAYEQVCI